MPVPDESVTTNPEHRFQPVGTPNLFGEKEPSNCLCQMILSRQTRNTGFNRSVRRIYSVRRRHYMPVPDDSVTTAINAWCKENSYRQSNSRELASELRKMGFEVTTIGCNKLYIKGMAATASS